MVSKLHSQGQAVYVCEICGYGYHTLNTAEQCEQYCDIQMRPSAKIQQKAVYRPRTEILPPIAET